MGDDWRPIIDQYQLQEFDVDYSKQYLQEAGIEESQIVDIIAEKSKGFPLLLYLSAETYVNMKNSGKVPVADDFGGSYPEIIERFLYNLDKDTVEVLRLMSIPNYYNTDIFDVLIEEFNISFPITEYEQFNKYSFVNYDRKENVYYVHDLIRASILDKTPDQVLSRAHRILLEYFAEKILDDLKTKYVFQMFYHARNCMSLVEFNKWLGLVINTSVGITPLDVMKKQQERGEQSTLIQIINGIRTKFDLSNLRIDLVNIYIDIVHLGGDYDVAVDICERYLQHYSEEEIYHDQQLLKMRIRKMHHGMFFLPVNELIEEAELFINGVDMKMFPEEYNELLFLLGGNLGVLSGELNFASEWLSKSMTFAKENHLEAFVHRTLRKQADIFLYNNDYDAALNLVNQVINKDSTIDDMNSRYKIYLMAVLGEIYRKQSDFEAAWNCYEIVDRKCTENYMPGWQAHAYLAKGLVKCQEQQYDVASDYFKKALAVYSKINQSWGTITTNEAMLLLEKNKGVVVSEQDLDKWKHESERMYYRYNAEFANRLKTEVNPYLQLFFL